MRSYLPLEPILQLKSAAWKGFFYPKTTTVKPDLFAERIPLSDENIGAVSNILQNFSLVLIF